MRMRTLDDQQRATLLDRLFRRIGKLDDDSLIELERLTRLAESGQPVQLPSMPVRPTPAPTTSKAPVNPNQQSRRLFLATLVAGGLLATATGGAAAVALTDDNVRRWLAEQGWLPTQTAVLPTATAGPSPTLPASPVPTLPASVRNQLTALQNQLAALTAERDTLRQQVTALGGQVKDANNQVADLKAQNSDFQDLLGLYQQLEAVGIDQIIASALAAVGVPLLAIQNIRLALMTGVGLAARVLQDIENHLPLVAAGLDWLQQQVNTLAQGIRAFQTALAVSADTPTTKAISDFISQLLDILPFGAGQNIKLALQAMGEVFNRLPDLLNNVSAMVIEPVRAWVGTDQQGGLRETLLRPLREQVLAPAQQIVANAENLNGVYNQQLAQPVQSALERRAKVRIEINKKAGALTG
jgi:hypothetical protein